MIDTKAIRAKVIDLAVQGSLSEQLIQDGTAKELLQTIIKKELTKPGNSEDKERPFQIPTSWIWTRLRDITTNETLNDGDWVLSSDMVQNGPVKLIQLGSIGDLQYRNKGFKYLTKSRFEELNGKQIFPGYILINRIVSEKMLVCTVPDIEGILITAVDACWIAPDDEMYDITYLMYALSSSCVQQRVKELGRGVTRFRISKLNLIDIEFPFPPLSEQRRIVAKVKEIFSLLETIDTLQKRYRENMSILKSKLIDAAIRGKLTKQLPEDGTAEELYQQIQQEKKKLAQEGKIKESKKLLPPVMEDEKPFIAPRSWKWGRLIDIFNFIDYRGATPTKTKTGIPFITAKNVRQGFIDYSIKEFISEEDYHNRQSRGISHKGDVLFTTEAPMGYAAIADLDTYSAGQRLITLQQYGESSVLDNKYYMYYIATNYFQRQLLEKSSGTTVKGIKADRLKQFVVPIPPLAEQKRIVECLEQLMKIYNY